MKLPLNLIKTEYPNAHLKIGNERFDNVYESAVNSGIHTPITINMQWQVIDGNHRVAVARYLNIDNIEVQIWTGTEMVI